MMNCTSLRKQQAAHWIVILAIIGLTTSSAAQRPSSPRKLLGVDEITLTSGKKLYGVVMDRHPDGGLTLVVERKWFGKTYPKLYKEHLAREIQSFEKSRTEALNKLDRWEKERSNDVDLIEFIKEEKARITKQHENTESKNIAKQPFTVISYLASDIREVFIQPAERRHIVGCAWKHKLDRVTHRTTAALARDLKKRGVDIATEKVDLSDQVASSTTQSENQWNARVALFEYVLRKKLDYQGTGSNLIRIVENNPANAQDLLGQFLSGELNLGALEGGLGDLSGRGLVDELLKELNLDNRSDRDRSNQTAWWNATTEAAERDGFRGVRVTRVAQSFGSPIAKVETIFFAKMAPGKWKQIAMFSATANGNQQSPEDIERIKADPQVQKVLGVVRGLGLGLDGNSVLETAIRQGAATEKAMQECEQKFLKFVDRYTVNMDSPPLSID